MEWGFEEEEYGVWGGLTSVERNSFIDESKADVKLKVLKDMLSVGVGLRDIKKNMRPKSKSQHDTWEYRA